MKWIVVGVADPTASIILELHDKLLWFSHDSVLLSLFVCLYARPYERSDLENYKSYRLEILNIYFFYTILSTSLSFISKTCTNL